MTGSPLIFLPLYRTSLDSMHPITASLLSLPFGHNAQHFKGARYLLIIHEVLVAMDFFLQGYKMRPWRRSHKD